MNISYSLYSPALIKHTEFSIARSCTKKGNYVIMKLNKLTKTQSNTFFFIPFFSLKTTPKSWICFCIRYIFKSIFLSFTSYLALIYVFYYRSGGEKNLKEALGGFCFSSKEET